MEEDGRDSQTLWVYPGRRQRFCGACTGRVLSRELSRSPEPGRWEKAHPEMAL